MTAPPQPQPQPHGVGRSAAIPSPSPPMEQFAADHPPSPHSPLLPSPIPPNIDPFLIEAVHSRNRLTVLRLEREIERFSRNPKLENLLLKPMTSSYERLAAHRIAQYYGLQSMVLSTVPPSVSRILLVKTPECRLPSIRLMDIPLENTCLEKVGPGEKIAIKQRETNSGTNGNCLSNSSDQGRTPTKSMEEREEEYDKARARIFSNRDRPSSGDEVDGKAGPVSLHKAEVQSSEHFPARGSNSPGSGDEKVPIAANTSRVAIFRDREKDMKDPDYDRSYSKYLKQPSMQSGLYGVMQGTLQEEFMQVNRPWRPQPLKELGAQQSWGPWIGSGYQNVPGNHVIPNLPNFFLQNSTFAPQYGYMSGTFQQSFQTGLPHIPRLSAVGR